MRAAPANSAVNMTLHALLHPVRLWRYWKRAAQDVRHHRLCWLGRLVVRHMRKET